MKNSIKFVLVCCGISAASFFWSFQLDDDDQKGASYLALGDSYTICESVEPNDRWPRQLASALRLNNVDIQDPLIIARTGWRCDQLRNAVNARNFKQKFDLVSLCIGVNNEFQGYSAELFKPEFEKCVEQAINHSKRAEEGVFVLSIPDYGCTPYGEKNRKSIGANLDEYNKICAETCDDYGVVFMDVTEISRRGLDEPKLVAADGLHPSAAQYKLWIDSILKTVEIVLDP